MILTNCALYDRDLKKRFDIHIENGIIKKITPHSKKTTGFDCRGRIACPGFIDVHIQGAGGSDILDSSREALDTISKTCAQNGVTGFLATTVYMVKGKNTHLDIAAQETGNPLGGARLLGIHLEGPFISLKKKGMIHTTCICNPSAKVMADIEKKCGRMLKMMTIAPELPGALPVIKKLVKSGCVASLGHSAATLDETRQGVKAGINHVTHIFNAMPSLHHREPGPLPEIFSNKKISVQVITDGVHLHEAVVRLVFGAVGPQRFITITDGMQALGLPEGIYEYNGVKYESKGGTARYKDGTLIGTATGIPELLSRLVRFTGCTLKEAVETVTLNPARLLRIEKKYGALAPGKAADITLIDKKFKVAATVVGGKIAYAAR